ncbi:hypothetical protein ACFS7Z_04475 [Pontibacter toksunensis]|uniref:Uncharacterized protein n=1 Tax=Pontibacter toksunensis TaxID=1332631 RepID=A0ABW6BQT0_9BACT
MKISLLSFFVLLFATAVLTSCEKCGEISVTKPTPEDAAWLVYKREDSIRFVSTEGNNVVYARSGIFANEFAGEGYTATDECIEKVNIEIRTVIEDVKDIQPSLSTRIFTKPGDLLVEIGVAEQGVWELDEQQPTYATYEVNGKVYNDVYEVVTNSTKAGDVNRILFNKAFGFLRLEFNGGKVLQLKNT